MSFLSVYLFVQGITEESLNLVLENGALTPHGKECKTLKYFSCRDLEKGQQAIKSGKPLTLRMSLSPVYPWVLGSGSGNASPRAKSCGHLLVWRKCQWNRGCTYSFRYDLWLLPPVMQSWVPVTETSGPAKPENTVFTVWCLDREFATASIRSEGITPRCVNPAVSPLFSSRGHVAISFLREFAVFS